MQGLKSIVKHNRTIFRRILVSLCSESVFFEAFAMRNVERTCTQINLVVD
jgi:hypothetical protein